ncbi:hypothetical protein C7I87_01560 [Mesorhizobium sp. SARCC-RB16n]|uniref:hypothetical protein n=1 Tax=Mesorhizobium sp. SARCC-RB16n TaxID=2116687 RepID=UPI00122F5148|nr:hypothetical protein [Mesorhizobium sp. SARCC-RB16n]KAA3452562.1 hypothetical protein C7I87_01560 [Mesorhizobium sp. SARCC-RB16n]
MPRYATIITSDDGLEVVSAIGEFEGAGPQARLGRVEEVATGVLIGMVREAAGGFCFPQPGIDNRAVGLAMAKLKARANAAKPSSAAKPAGRPKRAKRAGKKSARSKKAVRQTRSASPKAAAGDARG